jgi:hypothetical protein
VHGRRREDFSLDRSIVVGVVVAFLSCSLAPGCGAWVGGEVVGRCELCSYMVRADDVTLWKMLLL